MNPVGETYYERPVLKEPVWIWAVPAYFYAGGAAGAAGLLGAAAQATGKHDLQRLVRRCRRLALAGTAAGSALLIYDLGRPERFLNMLRVFRPTSPLNIGSWLLAASGATAGTATIFSGRVGDVSGYASGLLGAPLATYTAVVLSNSAVPAWEQARRSMPWLFAASALSATSSLLELSDLDRREAKVVGRLGATGKAAELASAYALEREAGKIARVGRPYKEGLSGSLWRTAKTLTAASLVLSLLGTKSRSTRAVGGLLGTAGALAVRFAVFYAGKASARDPRATFEAQRAGLGAAEVTSGS